MRAVLPIVLCAALLGAKPARKGDPMAPDTWIAAAANYEGKTVRTAALRLEEPGLVETDAPAAAIRLQGGNEQSETGGSIIVLVPASGFQAFTETYSSMEAGKGRSGFGVVAKHRVLSGTFVRIQGEPVLLVGIAANATAKLAKPSALLVAQLARAREADLRPSREGWQRRPFLLSRLDQRNQPETTRELQRLCDLANARDSSRRLTSREVIRQVREEGKMVLLDDKAQTEWLLTWE